jgi:hypothetical protein
MSGPKTLSALTGYAHTFECGTEILEASMDSIVTLAQGADPGVFLTWGVFGIQLGNLLVIIAMFVIFGLALVVPFPRGQRASGEQKK